jgi:aspartate racemase
MKTIGLIGGTGWVSTVEYYRVINQTVNKRLGGLYSAKCIIYSLNFAELDRMKKNNDFQGVYSLFKNAAVTLTNAGAECLLLCANTAHIYADALEKDITLPLIHIAEAAGREVKNKNLTRVGLLGTKQTMEEDFYKKRLTAQNIEVMIPGENDREFIDRSIFEELLLEEFKPETKQRFLNIISELEQKGAEGIILGCTEIPLIIHPEDVPLLLFNTTEIHATAAVEFALEAVLKV